MAVFSPIKATGSHFYKYQGPDLGRLKPIILDHLLYLPTAAQLDDPVDCRPKVKDMSTEEMVTFLKNDYIRRHPVLALDCLQEHESKIRTQIRTHGLDWFQHELVRILYTHTEQFRVYSLSKRFNNMRLWASYAANHTGYCLEFANEGPLFGEYVWKVVYGESVVFDLNDSENIDMSFLVTKRTDWSNQEEVRLICTRASSCQLKIQPQWLTRIILGKDMASEDEERIRAWAKQRDPGLTVVRAYFDELSQEIRLSE